MKCLMIKDVIFGFTTLSYSIEELSGVNITELIATKWFLGWIRARRHPLAGHHVLRHRKELRVLLD